MMHKILFLINMKTLKTLFGNKAEVVISTSRLSVPRNSELNCKLVSLANLKGMLVDKPQKLKLRFIVDTDGMLWFAREGNPSRSIPAHSQMTGSPFFQANCLAAGNFSFKKEKENEQYTLTIINKSGDFRPDLECLKWPIAILAVNLEKSPDLLNIKDEIVIKKSPDGTTELRFQITRADTIDWVNQAFSAQKIAVFKSQAVQNKPICYSPPAQDSEAAASAEKRSRLMPPEFSLEYMQAFGANSESTSQYSEAPTSTVKKRRLGFSMFNSAANGGCLALDDKENIGLDEITSPFRSEVKQSC
ncbi:MAG: hypothetical protein WCJ72_20165 [Chryseobacterium sp.]